MTALANAAASLPPVTLGELDATAALMTRTDRKYLLPESRLALLLEALCDSARVLEIDGARDFGYVSTYFDTYDRLSHRLAAQRRRVRFKVRTRVYSDSDACFLEVKTRRTRGVTVKERLPHEDGPRGLGDTGGQFVAGRLAAAGAGGVDPGDLRPALLTRYRRTTLLAGGTRLTLDRGLTWSAPDGSSHLSAGPVVVVETKSGVPHGSPQDRLLWRLGHRPVAFSKYATGLSLLETQLPSTRWQRTVRQHLTPTAHPGGDLCT